MRRKETKSFLCMTILALMCLLSCNPNCKEVKIQKVEWTTRYEDYYVNKDTIEEVSRYTDTLVSYSIVEHRTKVEYKKNSKGEIIGSTCVHYITIKNNNESYSNRFAVKFTGKEYVESSNRWKDLNKTTDYISVGPQRTYTFIFNHSAWWRNEVAGYNENNILIRILQESANVHKIYSMPKRLRQKKIRRIDNLIISDTIVNDCECDVEALTERYNTLKETFERLNKERLIITD